MDNKLTQITFTVTDEQFEALDSTGILDGAGIFFTHCEIKAIIGGPPIKKTLHDLLKEAHQNDNR